MSKNVALLLILVLLASCTIIVQPLRASSENIWASKVPMHEARGYMGVAAVNGRMYVIGGDAGSEIGNVMTGTGMTYHVVNTTEEYDPDLDAWIFKAPMPTARALFGIAVYQNKVYCIGGYNGTVRYIGPHDYDYKIEYFDVGVNEVYDPATNTWETKAAMPTPRYSAAANVVNGKIYLIGGHTMTDLQITLNVNEVYDPATDSWATKTPPPYKITSFASAVVDKKIYFIGRRNDSSEAWVGDPFIQIYDTANDSWSVGTSSLTSGFSATASATSGVNAPKRIYFFEETATYIYDPASNSWTSGTSMPTARLCATAAVINDKFYVVGGRTGQHGYITRMEPSAVNEQYTPIGYGTPDPSYVPPTDNATPEIAVLSPENKTYYTTDIPLDFTVNEPDSWMRYSLDAQTVAEISGNTTLTGLSYGLHNLTVYATDAAGNTGASETIYFTITKETETQPEPFPATLVAASAASVAVVCVGLLVYFKKRKH